MRDHGLFRGRTGIIHAVCYFGATSSGGLMAVTNGSEDRNITITRLYFDAHLLAAPVQILQVKSPSTFSSGVVDTAANVQKNYGSQLKHPMTVTVSNSDANVMSYTGGEDYHNFAISSLQGIQRNMNSTNIITPGSTILWGFDTSRIGGHSMGANESISSL